jgi:chemotaxis protein methyltransferase WspC
MSLAPVYGLLERRTGLCPEALGPTTVAAAVKARMRALDLEEPAAYAARLAGQPSEFEKLIDAIVVPETWFFRGGEVFPFLADRVRQTAGRRFRILSVPCSTGEEPYSLAIALTEAGVPESAWEIEGVDLSPRHVEQARQGSYSAFSLRQTDPERRSRYFRRAGEKWEITEALRGAVRFRQGNLIDPFFLSGERLFDLVLCRNLFIYLTPSSRRLALANLDRLLVPDGWLGTGPVEPLHLMDSRFQLVGPEGYFLYRRAVAEKLEAAPSALRTSTAEKSGIIPLTSQDGQEAFRPPPPLVPSKNSAPASEADALAQARQLADAGRLDEALVSCRDREAAGVPSADLFGLMGVIHLARHDRDEALRSFRKALYLRPDHPEALRHLMLLHLERGEESQAALLRRRLERAAPGGEP